MMAALVGFCSFCLFVLGYVKTGSHMYPRMVWNSCQSSSFSLLSRVLYPLVKVPDFRDNLWVESGLPVLQNGDQKEGTQERPEMPTISSYEDQGK